MEFIKISNQEARLKEYYHYLKEKEINGLSYVYSINESGLYVLIDKNHQTIEHMTNYLMTLKDAMYSGNTLRTIARDLKQFQDYVGVMELNLNESDLNEVLINFVDYIKITNYQVMKNQNQMIWTTFKQVPLKSTKVIQLKTNKFKERTLKDEFFEEPMKIYLKLVNVTKYFDYLKKTDDYKDMKTEELYKKNIYKKSIASTTNDKNYKEETVHLRYIMRLAGVKFNMKKYGIDEIKTKIPTQNEMKIINEEIDKSDQYKKLMFTILRDFGLRAGELSNLKINGNQLSKLHYMNYQEALDYLKNEKIGDIYYDARLKKWMCYVSQTESEDIGRQTKTGSRLIPLLVNENEFAKVYYSFLKLRSKYQNLGLIEHDYLFYKNYKDKNPINSQMVYTRVKTLANNVQKKNGNDFSWFSSHTFRHFYATDLLKNKRLSIDEVSIFLGHSSTETTRKSYIHYLPEEEQTDVLHDMKKTLKGDVNE